MFIVSISTIAARQSQPHHSEMHAGSHRPLQNKPKSAAAGKPSVCERCGKTFEKVSSLVQHFVAVHVRQLIATQRFACNDCGKKFTSLDFLHQHQWDSSGHTRVSKFWPSMNSVRECSRCSRKFKTSNCLEQHFVNSHALSEVFSDDEALTWHKIAGHFQSTWTSPKKKLNVIHNIFRVYNPGWRVNDFEQYKTELKSAMKGLKLDRDNEDSIRRVLNNGNKLVRFHGTRVKCALAEGSSQQLCSDAGCNLCRILETGFKKSKSGVESSFLRFGRGIYVSKTSSKANNYVKRSEGDGKRVMLVCEVLAGRVYRCQHSIQDLCSPPHGFHSVQGDPGPVLNYDELVVYDDRAILPAYIILYSTD